MNQKAYDIVAGILFLLIAVGHLLRIIFGWTAHLAGFAIPMWWSWIAFIVVAYMAFAGLRASRAST